VSLGILLLYALLLIGQPIVESRFGIFIGIGMPSRYEWILMGTVLLAGFLVGGIPSYRAYRLSLADGLSLRV
jgi:putative ABC transport system permease protein